jgi:hypothetical protein
MHFFARADAIATRNLLLVIKQRSADISTPFDKHFRQDYQHF